MYENYYGLLKRPFHITPDPEFLYLSPSHREALGVILYGIENGAGFMMITGAVGLGKTTILRAALDQLDHGKVRTILVFNPCLTYKQLVRLIYEELELELPESQDDYQVVLRLHLALIEEFKQGNKVVLIIDEAHNMPADTLENLRMLSNIETAKDKLLQIILVGQQPELDDLLKSNELRQLRQRIAHRATLVNLTFKESVDYIYHRLEIALGRRRFPFTKAAVELIAKHCEGVPRRINILCDNALVTGFGSRQNPVKPALVKEAIRDLDGRQSIPWLRWLMAPVALLAAVAIYFYVSSFGAVLPFKNLAGNFLSSQKATHGQNQ